MGPWAWIGRNSKYLGFQKTEKLLQAIRVTEHNVFFPVSTDYMELLGNSAQSGLYVAMTTPEFDLATDQCLSFDYDIKTAHGLQVYIRTLELVMAGRRVWQKEKGSGANLHLSESGHASINLKSTGSQNMKIDIVGIISSTDTIIRVAYVKLEEGLCGNLTCAEDEFPCVTSEKCVPRVAVCNGSSECGDDSDEEATLCGKYI